jgi:hypothetical protein
MEESATHGASNQDISRMTPKQKTLRPVPWLSGCLATLVALLIVAVALPNTDRAMVDNTVSPPRAYIQPQPWVVCYVLVIAFLPVLCIFILGRRWFFFELLGWIVLIFVLAGMFAA